MKGDTHDMLYSQRRNSDGVKELSVQRRSLIREGNKARFGLGLPPLVVKVRTCLFCQLPFESVGSRLCGCVDGELRGLRIGECG